MNKLPNPEQVRERLRSLSTKPTASKPTYDINKLHNDAMSAIKTAQDEARRQLSHLIDDNVLIDTTPPENIRIGWSTRYKSITFSLFDGEELKAFIVRSATNKEGEAIKWKTYGSKTFIPSKIDAADEVIFVSSGIGEYLLLEGFGVSYIALQSDHNDRHIPPEMIDATRGKIIVYFQDNDPTAKQLGQRFKALFGGVFVTVDFETVRDRELCKGYDLRDFCNEIAGQYGERAKEVIYQMINKEIKEGGTNAEI